MDISAITSRTSMRRVPVLLALAAASAAFVLAPARQAGSTATMSVSGTSSVAAAPGTPVPVGGLQVGGAPSAWATVTVSGPGTVTLPCASACSGATLVTGDGTADTLLRLHGATSDVNAALATLTATATAAGTVTISVAADDGSLAFLPDNGHFYEARTGPVDWLTARSAATAASHSGLTGYLVSITSDAESNLVKGMMTSTLTHIGVSDIVNEGYWYWVDGPEAGTGTGGYNHWLPGEPNGDGDGGVLWVDPAWPTGPLDGWNDILETSACCDYVIEYGGIGTYAPPTATITLTATVPTTTSSTTTTTTSPPTTTTTSVPATTVPVTTVPNTTTTSTSVAPTTSSTSTIPPDTTIAPVPPATDGTSGGDGSGGAGGGPPSPDWKADIRLDATIGDPVAGAVVRLEGLDLRPNTPVEAGVRSEYTVLTVAPTDATGRFSTEAALPPLEAGEHTIELRYEGSTELLDSATFTVDASGRIDSADGRLGVRTSAPYDPSDDVDLLLGLGVAALTILGATQTSSSSRSEPSSGGDDDGEDRSGTVSEVDATVQRVDLTGTGPGDRSRTHRAPGTRRLDAAVPQAATWLGPRVPLLARSIVDGSAIRAMFGSLATLVPATALALGVVAGRATDLHGATASVGILTVLIVLSAVDGMAGVAAALGLTLTTVAGGHVDGLDAFLSLGGMVVLVMSTPFIAAAARPLRRAPETTWFHRWDRVADTVIAALLAGWGIQSMTSALPGLTGRTVALADHADRLAVVAMAAVVFRIVLEITAARLYPARLDAIHVDQVPDPSTRRKALTITTRTALFCLASQRFIGANAWLVGGTLLYAVPQYVGLGSGRLPLWEKGYQLLPRGILKLAVMMVIGTAWASVVAGLSEGGDALRLGFVTLPIPGLIVGSIALFARKGPRPELGWGHRLGGLVLVIGCTLVATGHLL